MHRTLQISFILLSLWDLASFSPPPDSIIPLISLALLLSISFRIEFIHLVELLLLDSGYADLGTSPCFLIRFMAIFHCPPSPMGSDSRKCIVLSSTGLSEVSIMASKK